MPTSETRKKQKGKRLRKVIQICEARGLLAALCDDGTIWLADHDNSTWVPLPTDDIPKEWGRKMANARYGSRRTGREVTDGD